MKSLMAIKCTSIRPGLKASLKRWCNAPYINQWRGSRASLVANGRHHWASICTVLPWRPPGLQANNDDGKIPAVSWPFRWPWRCADTIPRASPNRGGPGLLWKQLVAATGQVLRRIVSINHAKADVFGVFSSSTC